MSIDNVVAGQPIMSAWGNSVADDLNRRGMLGYVEVSAEQGPVVAETDLTGLTLTFDTGGSRWVRLVGFIPLGIPALGTATLRVRKSTVQLARAQETNDDESPTSVGVSPTLSVEAFHAPAAGSATYRLTLHRMRGADDLVMGASTDRPAWFAAIDLGPV